MPETPRIKYFVPFLAAAICFATPLGTFDDQSAVGAMGGHAEFNPNTGEYAIAGSGNIAGASDRFHFVWKKVSGDVVVNADARFPGGAGGDRKAAIMVRQSLDPRAAYAAAVLNTNGAAELQYRPDSGAASKSVEVLANADLSSTVYMSLVRHGDVFTVSAGKRLKYGGPIPFGQPVTVTMNGPVYVGLAVASADPNTKDGAVFSNVYFQPAKAE